MPSIISQASKPMKFVIYCSFGILLSIFAYGILLPFGIVPGDMETMMEVMFYGILLMTIVVAIAARRTFFRNLFSGFGGSRGGKRRAFSAETKELVLSRQNHRCNVCGKRPDHWDFDHIGSRSNNSARNCQALCLDCHREKTIREKRQSKR